jgi:multidrug efflux pump subunit AcrA (membrane-fusion protein)
MIAQFSDIKRLFAQYSGVLQICVIALLLLLTFAYTRAPTAEEISKRASPTAGSESAEERLVSVIRPIPIRIVPNIKSTGTLGVRAYVTLSSQVGGRVVAVSNALRTGGSFTTNEELLVIDPSDFELKVEQAQADIDSAEATLKLRNAESAVAIDNYALLHGTDPVPPLVAKKPQIDQAKAQLSAAKARHKAALLEQSRSRFSLPFSGRVTESTITVGQLISPGEKFGRVFALDAVQVSVPITTQELNLIAPVKGRQATVTVNGKAYAAIVDRVAAELDVQTRFVTVYLTVEGDIAPGSFAQVAIEGAPQSETYLLPESAQRINNLVWIVEGNILVKVNPELILNTDEGMIVRAFDYKSGIVISSIPGAIEGLMVSVSESTQ